MAINYIDQGGADRRPRVVQNIQKAVPQGNDSGGSAQGASKDATHEPRYSTVLARPETFRPDRGRAEALPIPTTGIPLSNYAELKYAGVKVIAPNYFLTPTGTDSGSGDPAFVQLRKRVIDARKQGNRLEAPDNYWEELIRPIWADSKVRVLHATEHLMPGYILTYAARHREAIIRDMETGEADVDSLLMADSRNGGIIGDAANIYRTRPSFGAGEDNIHADQKVELIRGALPGDILFAPHPDLRIHFGIHQTSDAMKKPSMVLDIIAQGLILGDLKDTKGEVISTPKRLHAHAVSAGLDFVPLRLKDSLTRATTKGYIQRLIDEGRLKEEDLPLYYERVAEQQLLLLKLRIELMQKEKTSASSRKSPSHAPTIMHESATNLNPQDVPLGHMPALIDAYIRGLSERGEAVADGSQLPHDLLYQEGSELMRYVFDRINHSLSGSAEDGLDRIDALGIEHVFKPLGRFLQDQKQVREDQNNRKKAAQVAESFGFSADDIKALHDRIIRAASKKKPMASSAVAVLYYLNLRLLDAGDLIEFYRSNPGILNKRNNLPGTENRERWTHSFAAIQEQIAARGAARRGKSLAIKLSKQDERLM